MAMFGLPGGMEWVFILVIVLLLFGPSQLPKLAKTFGKSAKALREGLNEMNDDTEKPESAKAEKSDKSEDDEA